MMHEAAETGDAPTNGEPREDLAAIAVRATQIAPESCDGCASYHGSWTALRLISGRPGLSIDAPAMMAFLAAQAASKPMSRWMIAGMADTGVLRVAAEALRKSSGRAGITLVDLCTTPLKLCAEFAEANGLDVKIVRTNLAEFAASEPQDVIIAHSILSHIEVAEQRVRVLSNLRSALADGGALLIASRFSDRLHSDALRADADPEYARRTLEAVREAGISDAEALARLGEWIPYILAVRGKRRRGTFDVVSDLVALLRQGGFNRTKVLFERAQRSRRFQRLGRRQSRAVLAAWAD